MSDNAEMLDAKESSLAAVTDDSCTVKYIEIVPLDRPADDYCKPEFIERVVEVKPEDFQDMKPEPADENDSFVTNYSMKVRNLHVLRILELCYEYYRCQTPLRYTFYAKPFFLLENQLKVLATLRVLLLRD